MTTEKIDVDGPSSCLLDSMELEQLTWHGGPKESGHHLAARLLRLHHLNMLLESDDDGGEDPTLVDQSGKTVLQVLLMRLQTHWKPGRPLEPHPRFVLHLVITLLSRVQRRGGPVAEYIMRQDRLGFCALDYALGLGQLGLLAILLEQIADVGEELLLCRLCRAAVVQNRHDLVFYLATKVAACRPPLLLTPLLIAGVEGQRDRALQALLSIPAFLAAIDEPDSRGADGALRPLQAAVIWCGHCATATATATTTISSTSIGSGGERRHSVALQTIRYLLMKGACCLVPLSHAMSDNYFALAALHGQVDVIRILLEAVGHPIVAPSLDSERAKAGTFHLGHCSFRSNPLVSSLKGGHPACLEYLLEHTKFKALVNQGDGQGGLTPLAAAALAGDAHSVRLLLQHGADPGLRIDSGLEQPTYSSNEALVRASAAKIGAALNALWCGKQGSRQSHSAALAALKAQLTATEQGAREMKDSLLLVNMADKYAVLQIGTAVPSFKTLVVSVLTALKSASLFASTKRLHVSSDWAKVLFGRPSFFLAMAALMDNTLAVARDRLLHQHLQHPQQQKEVPFDEILRAVQAALESERANRSRWSVEVKSPRGRALLQLLISWCVWMERACLSVLSDEAAENSVLAGTAAPLLALHAHYGEYTAHLSALLRVPRFTLACNYAVRALPLYSGFKVAISNAAVVCTELSSAAPHAPHIGPSLRDFSKDWWWDVAEACDWKLLAQLLPVIFRFETDVEGLLCHAVAVQPPPSSLVLALAAHGLAAGKSDALLYDSVRRVDCDSFLVLLLTGLFDDDTARLWRKLRATLEWHMHHGDFQQMHSRLDYIDREQKCISKQGPGIADLRSPAAQGSLDERATVIAGILAAASASSSASTSAAANNKNSPLSRHSLTRKVHRGVLFCGLPLALADCSVFLASETVQARLALKVRRVWCCLSPHHRLGSVVSVETLSSEEGDTDLHVRSILGLHGEVLPPSSARWAFVDKFVASKDVDDVLDRHSLLGRFLCMPRLPSGVLLHAHGDLVASLARNNNPAIARCLLQGLQNRGMCCAHAPLPFCGGESLCSLAVQAASGAALKVYLKSLTTCPRFRGGVNDACGMGHTPNLATMTRPLPGADEGSLEIDTSKLLASLEDAAHKRLLQARRRLESMYYLMGKGAGIGEPLLPVLALVRSASALADLALPLTALLSTSRAGRAVARVCHLKDEASLLRLLAQLRSRPLAACCDLVRALQQEREPEHEEFAAVRQGDTEASSSSDSLWSRFCASFEPLRGASGLRLCDHINCLQEASLLHADPELLAWLRLREVSEDVGPDAGEWFGAAEGIVSEVVQAEEELAEAGRVRGVVEENVKSFALLMGGNVCGEPSTPAHVPLSVLPLVCLDGHDLRRALLRPTFGPDSTETSRALGSLVDSVLRAVLGPRLEALHARSHSSAHAYLAALMAALLGAHAHQRTERNRESSAEEVGSLDVAVTQLEAALRDFAGRASSQDSFSGVLASSSSASLDGKIALHVSVCARALCSVLQHRLRSRASPRSRLGPVTSTSRTPLLAAVRGGHWAIVRDLLQSRVFPLFDPVASEYSDLERELCVAAAASGNVAIMQDILSLAQRHTGRRLKMSGWTPLHASITGCESLQEALSRTPLSKVGLSSGCEPGMTRPAGIWSVGSWAVLSKESGRNTHRMRTLAVCLQITDLFDMDDLASTAASASFMPSVLDMAAAAAYAESVGYMLRNGVLDGLARQSVPPSGPCFLFAHAAALSRSTDVFLHLGGVLASAAGDAAGYPSTLRLLHGIVTSTRTFVPQPPSLDALQGQRRKKWRGSAAAAADEAKVEEGIRGAQPVLGAVMLPAENPRHRHSLLHDAIVAGAGAGADGRACLESILSLTLALFAEYNRHGDGNFLPGYCTAGLLLHAAYAGDAATLSVLLQAPWSLHPDTSGVLPFPFVDQFIWAPLQASSFRGKHECVQVLLDSRRCSGHSLRTSLSLAVCVGADTCAALLAKELLATAEAGASEEQRPPALREEAGPHLLRGCAEHGMWRFLEVLLEERGPLAMLGREGEADSTLLSSALRDSLQRGHVRVALVLRRRMPADRVAACLAELAKDCPQEALARFSSGDAGAPDDKIAADAANATAPASSPEMDPSDCPPPDRPVPRASPSVWLKMRDGRVVLIKGARSLME